MTDEQAGAAAAGSVADEAARLLDALGGWVSSVQEQAGHSATGEDAGPGHRATGDGACGTPIGQGAACSVCPLCRGIAVARALHPEAVERLADLAAVIAASLRDLATSPVPTPHDATMEEQQ